MKELAIGCKVEIPLTKSVGCSWGSSITLNRAKRLNQCYLYIINIHEDECELHFDKNAEIGESFLLKEVNLWSEESNSWETINTIQNINEEIKEKSKTKTINKTRTAIFS